MAFTISRAKIAPCIAKVETTYGTDSTPNAATAAFYTLDSAITRSLNASNIDFNTHNSSFTRPAGQIGKRSLGVNFNFMLQGSAGNLGTAHPTGDILQCCGMTETATAGVSVVYAPSAITALKSATVKSDHGGGIVWNTTGVYGNCVMTGNVNDGCRVAFTGRGLYAAAAAGTITSWTPEAMAAKACLALAGSITPSGGADYTPVFDSFSFNRGADIQDVDDMNDATGLDRLLFADAVPTLDIVLALDMDEAAALTYPTMYTNMFAVTTHSVKFTIGASQAGNAIHFAFPQCQLRNIQEGEKNGYRTVTLSYLVSHTTANTEFSITIDSAAS